MKRQPMNLRRNSIFVSKLGLIILAAVFWTTALETVVAQNPAKDGTANRLRWIFQKGETYSVELAQIATVVTEVDQRSRKVDNDMRMSMNWTIDSVDEAGVATMSQEFTRIVLNMVTPTDGGEKITTVDTDDASKAKGLAKKHYQQIRPLINAKFIVKISPRGEILSVVVPREAMDSIREAPSSMQLRKVLTEEGLKKIVGRTAMVLPEHALAQGDSWTEKREMASPLGSFDQIHHFTYNGPSDNNESMHEFLVKSDLVTKKTGNNGGSVVDFKGSGKMVLDAKRGFFTHSEFSTQMTTKKPYRDLIINTTVKIKVTMVITKT